MVTAFFSQLYLSLKDRILDRVPEIKWIDLDLGQLEHYDTRPPVAFPCVLIDFPDASYKAMGGQVQWGDPVVQLRLGFDSFTSANSAAPTLAQEQALTHFELEQALFAALQGWTPIYNAGGIAEPLVRSRAATEQREDPFRVRVIHYTTAFQDDGAAPAITRVTAKMLINSQG